MHYFPAPTRKNPSPSIILCPGGGYNYVLTTKMDSIAKWLNQNAVSALIPHYRVPKKRNDAFKDIQ